ncbi:MAG TPA: hypothetical protein VFK05_19890 [Polyangiaceae bacterium]|nr:hypothetical protein [Polyangiaceae bacterium]
MAAGPAIPAPLSAQSFGVAPELIPRFLEAILARTPRLRLPNLAEPLATLTARVDAERSSCAGGSNDACLKFLDDCESAESMPPGGHPGLIAILGTLQRECRTDGHPRAILPAACEGGSVAACDRLLEGRDHQALLPRACDVGSRNACIELSQLLGFTTRAGEAARLRALELGRCASGDSACLVHSRAELTEAARNTLRAGMNRVCVQRGAAACHELARQFDREHSDLALRAELRSYLDPGDSALRAELRSYDCELGDAQSCSLLATMYAEGSGVPRDEQRALALNERARAPRIRAMKEIEACKEKDCQALKAYAQARAPMLANQDSMNDAQVAPELATRKCNGGDLSACSGLINAFTVGNHRDPLRAAEFRRKAVALLETQCHAGNEEACDTAAQVLIELGGLERTRGLGSLDRSCNGGRLSACLALAMKSEDRQQKEAAMRRALPLQEAACNAGNAMGCLWAANEYRARDPSKSAALEARGQAIIMRGIH